MIVVLARDLIITSRIAEAAARAGRTMLRIDDPAELPEPDDVELTLVDWADRDPSWPGTLRTWLHRASRPHRPRVVLFGPHTDLAAHQAARAAGLGPMMARSRLVSGLGELIA